jgi:dihydroorotate dehydrogenase electron transfer subunit
MKGGELMAGAAEPGRHPGPGCPPEGSRRPEIVDERAQVLSLERASGGVFRALLLAPEIARRARPMQFVQVKVREGHDPFLRRPFSLSLIDADAGLIGITWDVVGAGTGIMAGWEPGREVMVLGPLGNGFDPDDASPPDSQGAPRRMLLVAGGTGLAPMYPLAVVAKARGWDIALFYGARTADFLLDTSEFQQLGCAVSVVTDDGSAGVRSLVTGAAAPSLHKAGRGDIAVACGPTPMLKAVKPLCKKAGVELYLSLEERMACGTGLCRGCAVKAARGWVRGMAAGAEGTVDGGPEPGYLHVCLDGPVFRAEDVDLGGEG